MLLGSIGFAFVSSAGFAAVAPRFSPVCIGGGFVCGFFVAAGDLPVSGVFSGSVCACNANAINKQKSETKSDFFIQQRNARPALLSIRKIGIFADEQVERVVLNALPIYAALPPLFNIVFGEADPPFYIVPCRLADLCYVLMNKSLRYAVVLFFAAIAVSMAGVDKAAIEAKEKTAWQTFKDKDAAGFKKVVDKDFLGVYAEGVSDMDKELSDMKKWEMKSFTIGDYKAISDEKDVIVTTYTVKIEGTF